MHGAVTSSWLRFMAILADRPFSFSLDPGDWLRVDVLFGSCLAHVDMERSTKDEFEDASKFLFIGFELQLFVGWGHPLFMSPLNY